MFTRKVSAYFALASVLLVIGLFFEDWQLAAMVLPVASLFFLANLFGLPEKVDLETIHQVSPSDSFGDEDIVLQIGVLNKTGALLGNVEVDENLPELVKLERGSNRILTQLVGHERIDFRFEFHSPARGHYRIGPLTVRVRDSFGFYIFQHQHESEVLAIMPRPERIRGGELRPRYLGPWPGSIRARIRGSGTEFYSIREYVSGDDPKRINWKASAKHGHLFVNEMEAERVTDVMIVLDTDISFYEGQEAELFERGVRAAASMASLVLRQGNRVGMILQGGERGVVAPSFGKRHERNILFLLASAAPGRASLSTSYVMTLLAHLMLPAMAQVVVISPLLDRALVGGIRSLAAAGYSILTVSPSPRPPTRFQSPEEEIAYRILMLERSNTMLALEKVCGVAQWPPNVPLSTVLRDVKRPRPVIRV